MTLQLHPLQLSYGTYSLLGQRQSFFVAHPPGAGAQEVAIRVSAAALRQAGAPISANAEDEPARACAGAEGRRLCGLRVRGHPVLPRSEVPSAADLWAD